MEKIKTGVLFGGCSGEHVVSLHSAQSIMKAIDKDKHEVIPVGITREGRWIAGGDPWKVLWENASPENCCKAVPAMDPLNPGILLIDEGRTDRIIREFISLDIVFPVLHGPYGEDGTVQGVLELSGIPYVGSGVMGSSAGMDKVIMKQLFTQNSVPVGPYLYFKRHGWEEDRGYWKIRVDKEIGYPCFVKPANLGSSVGISKVYSADQLEEAVIEAFNYDEKAVIEAHIGGKEVECSVLGDETASASTPGEIIPCNDFYDYRSKYIDDRSELIIPARLPSNLKEKVRQLSVSAFKAVEASGLARVDFFVDEEKEEVTINEINTMPGFTTISMYPKLWEASGIPYPELVERLIRLGIDRHKRKKTLSTAPPLHE